MTEPTSTWQRLSPTTRKLIAIGGVIDAALRIAALIDLARRPATDLRGSKGRWAAALAVLSTGGILPAAYFALARKPRRG